MAIGIGDHLTWLRTRRWHFRRGPSGPERRGDVNTQEAMEAATGSRG
jgi:hypothetical protein